ncbi:unnamed protein product [Amoebophrya sp. A120]|nr:unnamed protein product [Amoebophrya sp. A120]|eukprot:GSA120T00005757001.1
MQQPDLFSSSPPRRQKRRFIVARQVGDDEFAEFAGKMEKQGLDPIFDAAPPNFAELSAASPTREDVAAAIDPAAEEFAKAANATRKTMKNPFTRWDRKMSGLNNLTVGEKINAQRHQKALARWEKMKQEWEKFRGIASKVTDRPKEALTITAAEEYRERVELMDLIDRATPDFIKSGGYGWYQSLRDYGARLVTIGNIFSGLYLYIKLKPNANGQIIRKPWLRELAYYRAKNHSHTWRDNPFLIARKKRYGAAMEMMNPGLLGIDEMLEIDGVGAEKLQALREQAQKQGAEEPQVVEEAEQPEAVEEPSGPAVELEPSRLEFHCLTGEKDTAVLTIRNTGSTVLFWELEELPPVKHYEESVTPADPTKRFQTHVVKGKIFPSNEQQITVTFLSATAGSFTSRWRLKTNPNMVTEDYVMHGVSFWRHADIISDLQQELHTKQVDSQCSECVEDLFHDVDVTPFPEPDFTVESIRSLYFEERNAGAGSVTAGGSSSSTSTSSTAGRLHYRSEYFTKLSDLLTELREFARAAGMENQILWRDERGKIFQDYEYGDHVHYSEEEHAAARGHLPLTKPLEPVPISFGPDFQWDLRLQELKDILRDVEPQNPEGPEIRIWRRMRSDLLRLERFFSAPPLDRSPAFSVIAEETTRLANLVIDEWATAREAVADPSDADALTAAKDAFCDNFSLFTERKKMVTNEEGEPVEEAYVSTILDKNCEQVLDSGSLRSKSYSSTSQAVGAYRKKMTTEQADPAGQVVLYEMDLSSIAGVEAVPKKGGEEGEVTYELDGPHINDLTIRLEAGLTDIIAANPKALFICAHVDSTVHASNKNFSGEEDPPIPTTVPGCVSFEEDLDLMIKKITGVACEFITLEELGKPEFAAEIRKETEEEEELAKIYLIENLASQYLELGGRRIDDTYERFTWAARENWVDQKLFPFGIDVYVQDSFSCALRGDYTTQKYLSWDRPALPARVVGPFVDAEMQNLFSEVLKMPDNAAAGSSAEHTATENEEGEEQGDGLQVQVVGGVIEPGNLKEGSLEKIAAARNVLEELSQLCFVGGNLALILVRFVFNCGASWFPNAEENPTFAAVLRDELATAVQNADRCLLIPTDFLYDETPPPDADPADKKKPYLLKVGGTTLGGGTKTVVYSDEITYGAHKGKCLVLETQEEAVSGVWNACGRISLVEVATLRASLEQAFLEEKQKEADAAAAAEAGEEAAAATGAEAAEEAEAPASPYEAVWTGGVPEDMATACSLTDLGPSSVAQVKRLLTRSKAVVVTDKLAPVVATGEGVNAPSDVDLWEFVELRMQPVRGGEEEEEDEDGNPIPRKEKPPKPEKWAEFESSMFVGKELAKAVVAYKPEHSYSLVVDKIPEVFLSRFLSGAPVGGIACLSDKPGKKRALKTGPVGAKKETSFLVQF